mmetsp:Transcript_25468/g.60745  ORF Transcript_25468/g.60745 Transcript_25468/m.60745 type:complete len:390 (-) Transcript_25468:51-1220(-)
MQREAPRGGRVGVLHKDPGHLKAQLHLLIVLVAQKAFHHQAVCGESGHTFVRPQAAPGHGAGQALDLLAAARQVQGEVQAPIHELLRRDLVPQLVLDLRALQRPQQVKGRRALRSTIPSPQSPPQQFQQHLVQLGIRTRQAQALHQPRGPGPLQQQLLLLAQAQLRRRLLQQGVQQLRQAPPRLQQVEGQRAAQEASSDQLRRRRCAGGTQQAPRQRRQHRLRQLRAGGGPEDRAQSRHQRRQRLLPRLRLAERLALRRRENRLLQHLSEGCQGQQEAAPGRTQELLLQQGGKHAWLQSSRLHQHLGRHRAAVPPAAAARLQQQAQQLPQSSRGEAPLPAMLRRRPGRELAKDLLRRLTPNEHLIQITQAQSRRGISVRLLWQFHWAQC